MKKISPTKLFSLVKKFRAQGKKIAFTNGCFDLLHPGHIKLLEEAKKSANILIVGLNSDKSVRLNKGDNRPILKEKERLTILSSISYIDYIVVFEEKTPLKIIKKIKPDFLLKGEDWPEEKIAGAKFIKKYGGRIKRVKLIKNQSTTSLINRIINRYGKGSSSNS